LGHLGSFPEHNFRFESWENLFLQFSLGGEEWLVLVDGGKRENRSDDSGNFERMEVSRIVLGIWNFREISQDLLGFVAQVFTDLGADIEIW
jgi:hypothetical protein